jgi:hypothetical protein
MWMSLLLAQEKTYNLTFVDRGTKHSATTKYLRIPLLSYYAQARP